MSTLKPGEGDTRKDAKRANKEWEQNLERQTRHAMAERHAREAAQPPEKLRQEGEKVEKAVAKWRDPGDPGHRETDRVAPEAKKTFGPKEIRSEAHQMGQEEHERWTEERVETETKAGRVKGRDFDVNATTHHPDGKPVYLDYVDYENDTIVDRKSIAHGETEEHVKKQYEGQRQRHIDAYEHATGRQVRFYDYSLYPSSKDIFLEDGRE